MKRTILISTLAAVALAGCGSSSSTTSTAKPATPAATIAVPTYFDMTLLASDVEDKINANLRKLKAGEQIHGMTCIKTGSQSADCLGTVRGGPLAGTNETLTVAIAADGQSYITHGTGN